MSDKPKLHPEALAAWQKGVACMQDGRWSDADAAFSSVLKAEPQAHLAWLQRARCAVAMGQSEAAHAHFTQPSMRSVLKRICLWRVCVKNWVNGLALQLLITRPSMCAGP